MARSAVALLCLAVADACSPQNCSTCTAPQCAATVGCRHFSLSSDEHTVPFCDADCPQGSFTCCTGKRLKFSLSSGFTGGIGAFAFSCALLGFLQMRRWSKAFLEEGNPEVLRASATLLVKLLEKEDNPVPYSVRLRFQTSDGVVVSGVVHVFAGFWEVVNVGEPVEVAYNIKEPRDLVIVENERLRPARTWLLCVLGLLAVLGAVVSTGQTGCPVAELTFLAMLLAGAVWGRFLWLPLARFCALQYVKHG